MSYFHLSIDDMSITLDDVSSLLHLPIRGRLLNYSRISRPDVHDMMVQYLVVDSCDAQKEIDDTRRWHARFSFLKELYKYHLVAVVETDGYDAHVLYHRACALRSYLMYLVGTSIFVDKSDYYVDVVYLRYFIDFEQILKYN